MSSGNIASEWESFAATVNRKQYYPVYWEDEENGLEATRVVASFDERHVGWNCPDGYQFDGDGSYAEASTNQPNTRKDMVEMHKPFSIPEKARTEWLGCFREVLEKLDVSDEAKQQFWNYLEAHSKHTVNVDSKVKLPEEMTLHHK